MTDAIRQKKVDSVPATSRLSQLIWTFKICGPLVPEMPPWKRDPLRVDGNHGDWLRR